MYYGQIVDGRRVDEVLYERYFRDKRNGFFIECGAYDGIFDSSCNFFEKEFAWKGINIEAFPFVYDKLAENRKNSFANLCFALSDKNDVVVDFVSTTDENFNALGSIGGNDCLLNCLEGNVAKLTKTSVKTITYKEITNRYNVQSVDLFVLDVEGNELKVLEGMKGCSVIPKVMCVEYGHVGLDKVKQIVVKQIGMKFDFSDSVNAFFTR
jgi:FkbM family methyltransferase